MNLHTTTADPGAVDSPAGDMPMESDGSSLPTNSSKRKPLASLQAEENLDEAGQFALAGELDLFGKLVSMSPPELEEAIKAMRTKSVRLELALDASQAGTWSWFVERATADWDNRNRRLFGIEDDLPVSADMFFDRVHSEDREGLRLDLENLLSPGAVVDWKKEFRILHPTLGIRWICCIGRLDRDHEGNSIRFSGINFDITDRKLAEESMRAWNQSLEFRVAARTFALNQSEARFRQLAEATFEGIAVSENGIIIDGNPQLAGIMGYDLEEMIGRPILDFIAPESRQLAREHILGGVESRYEFIGLRKDGSTFPAESHACMRTWQGKETRVAALRDLSAVKEASARLQALLHELADAQKLALVSEVSAGIAHQIGQPLTAIGVNVAAALARHERGGQEPCEHLTVLKEIAADVERMRSAINHLRSLANPDKPDQEPTQINPMVERVSGLLAQEAANRGVMFSIELGSDLPVVAVDPVQMSQVVLNLIKNALDSCDGTSPGEKIIEVTTKALTGEGVEIRIRDTGVGLSEESLLHLFDPFYSTKEDGMGIGLRLSRTIVHAHGGMIEGFNNDDGPGATFRVIIPLEDSMKDPKV
jgi:two-component system, LuxR family, sensor kinase FixL